MIQLAFCAAALVGALNILHSGLLFPPLSLLELEVVPSPIRRHFLRFRAQLISNPFYFDSGSSHLNQPESRTLTDLHLAAVTL